MNNKGDCPNTAFIFKKYFPLAGPTWMIGDADKPLLQDLFERHPTLIFQNPALFRTPPYFHVSTSRIARFICIDKCIVSYIGYYEYNILLILNKQAKHCPFLDFYGISGEKALETFQAGLFAEKIHEFKDTRGRRAAGQDEPQRVNEILGLQTRALGDLACLLIDHGDVLKIRKLIDGFMPRLEKFQNGGVPPDLV